MTTDTTSGTTSGSTPSSAPTNGAHVDLTRSALRRLYLGRFAFALVWAGLFAATSSPVAGVAVVLLVLYPAFDAVAAVVDARTSGDEARSSTALRLNVVLSVATAVALAVVGDDAKGILLVWGAWAVTAGAVQLVVAVLRRRLGGQVPMMLSGGLSVLAGLAIAASSRDADSLVNIAGYAVVGGLFFLVSALRLGRPARPVDGSVA